MIIERFPWVVDVLTIVVIGHVGYTIWHVNCCRKAKQAYAAAKILWKWVKDGTAPIKCMLKATGCGDSDPTWPPESLGDFPPPLQ